MGVQQGPFDEGHPNPEMQDKWPGKQSDLDPMAVNTLLPTGEYKAAGKLQGKKALITGGDSGIGRAVAVMFASEGCDSFINYLPQEQKDAEETKRIVEEKYSGRKCHLLAGDIQEASFCRHLVDEAAKAFGGKIDILINNAAYQMECQEIADLSDENWDRTFKTNIYAMFWISKQAVKQGYLQKGATIVNNASINAYIGRPDLLDYTTTKGAIVSFTRGLANQLVSKGIRCNAVAPGPVTTPLVTSTFSKENIEGGGDTPMGRPAQPSEIATTFAFLAGPDSSFITGQVIHVNGGMFTTS